MILPFILGFVKLSHQCWGSSFLKCLLFLFPGCTESCSQAYFLKCNPSFLLKISSLILRSLIHMELICEKDKKKFHFILLHIDIQFSKKIVSNAIFSPYFWHRYWKRSIHKYVDYNWFSSLSHWLISVSNYMSLPCSFYYKVKWGTAIPQQCLYCTWLFGITPGPLWFCVYPY